MYPQIRFLRLATWMGLPGQCADRYVTLKIPPVEVLVAAHSSPPKLLTLFNLLPTLVPDLTSLPHLLLQRANRSHCLRMPSFSWYQTCYSVITCTCLSSASCQRTRRPGRCCVVSPPSLQDPHTAELFLFLLLSRSLSSSPPLLSVLSSRFLSFLFLVFCCLI